jgi:hypothetical protein
MTALLIALVWLAAGLLVARLFRINRQDKDNES